MILFVRFKKVAVVILFLVNKGFVTGNLYETQRARDVINGLSFIQKLLIN